MRSDDSWHRRQRSKVISGNQENLLSLFQVYLYLVPLLAIFYLIPSAQMVFMLEQVARETNQKVTTSTKDSQGLSHPIHIPLKIHSSYLITHKQCYRNFGCSRPWGIFEDVNHIISNLGYIVYGAAFILMVNLFRVGTIFSSKLKSKVYLKSWMLPERNSPDQDHRGNFGLAQQHSIFYTMGFSMIMQVSTKS